LQQIRGAGRPVPIFWRRLALLHLARAVCYVSRQSMRASSCQTINAEA
jgi:hypothetical protein